MPEWVTGAGCTAVLEPTYLENGLPGLFSFHDYEEHHTHPRARRSLGIVIMRPGLQAELSLIKAGSVWGALIGDALAMPVHWYYDRAALHRD